MESGRHLSFKEKRIWMKIVFICCSIPIRFSQQFSLYFVSSAVVFFDSENLVISLIVILLVYCTCRSVEICWLNHLRKNFCQISWVVKFANQRLGFYCFSNHFCRFSCQATSRFPMILISRYRGLWQSILICFTFLRNPFCCIFKRYRDMPLAECTLHLMLHIYLLCFCVCEVVRGYALLCDV